MTTEEMKPSVFGWSAYEDEGFVGAFATAEEALKDAHESVGKEGDIYIQEGYYEDVLKIAPSGGRIADELFEVLGELADDECGEAAEGWPDVSDEARSELVQQLDDVIRPWIKKHLKMPAWTPVGDPVKHAGQPVEE